MSSQCAAACCFYLDNRIIFCWFITYWFVSAFFFIISLFLSLPCYQLIELSLQAAARDMASDRPGPPVEEGEDSHPHPHTPRPLTLPGIHLVHAAVQHRLQLCAQTFQLCPDIVTKLVTQYEQRQEPPTEMVWNWNSKLYMKL